MYSQKLIAILQIRSRNYADFNLWINWYLNFIKCDLIYIVDDNSQYDLNDIISLYDKEKIIYKTRKCIKPSELYPHFNQQQKNVNGCLEEIRPNSNDIIIIPDDDEFWWFDSKVFNDFKTCVNSYRNRFENIDALYVPWTLMRSKEIIVKRKPSENFFNCFKYRSNITNCEHKPIMFYKGPIDTSFHLGYKNGHTITEPTNLFYHSVCKYDLPLRCYHFRFTTIDEYMIKKNSDASNHRPRSYFKDQFSPQIFNGQDQNSNYDILDTTLIETLKTLEKDD